MAKDETPGEERRRAATRHWTGPERRSRFATGAAGQLLERGEGVADPVGSLGDDRDVFSGEGEPGTNIGGRFGGPVHDVTLRANRGDEPDHVDGGTGGEGGFSTLAGGIYNGEGSADDAPNYGDWTRHSTGTTSGAIGHEGFDFEGEGTWGESERARESVDETGETSPGGRPKPDLELPDDQGDGADDRHTDLDGPTEPANDGGGKR